METKDARIHTGRRDCDSGACRARGRNARSALRAAFWAGAEAARQGRDNGANADAQVEEIIALWQEAETGN